VLFTKHYSFENLPTSKSSWEFSDPLKILMFGKNFIQEKFSNTHKYLCVLENKNVQSLLDEYRSTTCSLLVNYVKRILFESFSCLMLFSNFKELVLKLN
jgi:hypothetical protein